MKQLLQARLNKALRAPKRQEKMYCESVSGAVPGACVCPKGWVPLEQLEHGCKHLRQSPSTPQLLSRFRGV